MKTMRLIVFGLLLVSLQAAGQTKFVKQTAGHIFTLNVPDYMLKTYELNDAASLQYQNSQKEAYVIVIEDSKEQLEKMGIKFMSVKDFLDDFTADYKTETETRNLTEPTLFTANGNSCAQTELTWTEEGEGFYMLITTVESKTHLYKILCWTVAANEQALKADYLAMAKTLKD